jgi:hypothetical protein
VSTVTSNEQEKVGRGRAAVMGVTAVMASVAMFWVAFLEEPGDLLRQLHLGKAWLLLAYLGGCFSAPYAIFALLRGQMSYTYHKVIVAICYAAGALLIALFLLVLFY